jgi:uncharacterized membrane protein
MGENRLSMGEAVRFGWDTTKSNIGFFIGLLIVAFLIENIPGVLSDIVVGDFPIIAAILTLAGVLLGIVVQMGLIKVSLKFCDGIKGKLDDLLSSFKLLFKFVAAAIIYMLIVLGGMILLFIPGIIWGIKFSLFPYFIVDNELGPIAALKASGEATDGAKWNLFVFGLLLGLINLAGAFVFLVGLFVTIPTSMVAYAYAYRELSGGSSAPQENPGPAAKGVMFIKLEA